MTIFLILKFHFIYLGTPTELIKNVQAKFFQIILPDCTIILPDYSYATFSTKQKIYKMQEIA